MDNISKFKQLALFISDVTARRQKEYNEFLSFYRELVETMPADVCKIFGEMPVNVSDKKNSTYRILLSVSDYMFWKDAFESGIFFTNGPKEVIKNMSRHLSLAIEKTGTLTPDERKKLLAILLDK